jgi:hypothetical protein
MNHKGHDTKRLGIEGTPSPRKEISLSSFPLTFSSTNPFASRE